MASDAGPPITIYMPTGEPGPRRPRASTMPFMAREEDHGPSDPVDIDQSAEPTP